MTTSSAAPFGGISPLRRAATLAVIRLARGLMPLLVALAGRRCWRCGRSLTPTAKLTTYSIVEARVWAWNEVICDECIRKGLGKLHHS